MIKERISESLKKIAKGALIAMGGALCAYLLQISATIDFGAYTGIVVAVFSIIINALKVSIEHYQNS